MNIPKGNPEPKVAFVLVCWNNQDLLEECFKSIESQDYMNHITIMVDNGSEDSSISYTRENFPWVDVIDSGQNHGFAKGNNIGIKRAISEHQDLEYLVFLNTDARLEKNWLRTLINFALCKPKGALFQSITLDYYDPKVIDSTHIYIARDGSGTQSGWRTPYISELGPKKVFGVNAAAAMISRSFIEEQPFNDLFNETMFMYLEDVDLSARATVMGWDNYVVPGTLAYHMGSASSGKNPGFSLYMTYRNNIALLAINMPFIIFVRILPALIRSDRHTLRHLKRIGQASSRSKLIKGRIIGFIRLPLYSASIFRMRRYRMKASKSFLWQIMRRGSI